MANETTISFRPRKDNNSDWELLHKEFSRLGINRSQFFNSIIPLLVPVLQGQTPNHRTVYEVNLGEVKVR